MLVAQSCPTLFDPIDCSPPGSSVNGILQARILEWVAMPFSRGSSQTRDWACVTCIAGRCFTICTTRKALRCLSVFLITPWRLSFCYFAFGFICFCSFRLGMSFPFISKSTHSLVKTVQILSPPEEKEMFLCHTFLLSSMTSCTFTSTSPYCILMISFVSVSLYVRSVPYSSRSLVRVCWQCVWFLANWFLE